MRVSDNYYSVKSRTQRWIDYMLQQPTILGLTSHSSFRIDTPKVDEIVQWSPTFLLPRTGEDLAILLRPGSWGEFFFFH